MENYKERIVLGLYIVALLLALVMSLKDFKSVHERNTEIKKMLHNK